MLYYINRVGPQHFPSQADLEVLGLWFLVLGT
jgi:hypothetical protein